MASDTISVLMSSCLHDGAWPVLPTSIFLASRRAKSRMSGDTRSSNRITSADCSARTARNVKSSGSPGPAPTRITEPPSRAVTGSSRRVEIGVARIVVGGADRARRKLLPKTPAAAERQRQRLHAWAPMVGGVRPACKAFRDQCFDLGADRLTEYRRGAVGRNADHERRAIDDGAKGKIAEVRPVDDIDGHASRARRVGEPCGRLVVSAVGNGDGGAGEIVRHPWPVMKDDGAARRRGCERKHVLIWRRRKNVDHSAGRRKQLRLPGRGRLPPATMARLPSSAKNAGSRDSGAMRVARISVGERLIRGVLATPGR